LHFGVPILKKIYVNLRDGGTHRNFGLATNLSIQHANLCLLLTFISGIDYSILTLIHKDYAMFYVQFLGFISYNIGFQLIRRSYTEIGKLVSFLTLIVTVFLSVDATGQSKNFHFFYLAAIALPFVIFANKFQIKVWLCILLAFAAWMSSFILPTNLIINSDISRDYYSKWEPIIFIPIALTFMLVMAYNGIIQLIAENENQKIKLYQQTKLVALGEMASGVAHEINNPLAIVSSNAAQMKRSIESGRPINNEAFIKHISMVTKHTDRIAGIIRGLREFSRDAENDPFVIVNAASIVEDTLNLCLERFSQKGIQLKTSICKNLNIECRPTQITQVIINLLNNAYDAVLPLDSKWIEVAVIDSFENIKIVITDSGQGVDSKIAHKIMQPFFTTKDIGKGTGLGLSVSKGIIESHHGQLYLNTEATNTQFVIELPKTIAERNSA